MFLAPLATMATASARNGAIQRKIGGRGVVKTEKEINLVILNQDVDNIIKKIKSLENQI